MTTRKTDSREDSEASPESSKSLWKGPRPENWQALHDERRRLQESGCLHGHLLDDLDDWQLQAVLEPGSTVIRAQVGCGKTRVLLARAVHLLCQGVAARDICIMTFSRRAARDMQERLEEILGALPDRPFDTPLCGTFHHVAWKLVQESRASVEEWSILDEPGRHQLLDELISREGLVIKYRRKVVRRLEQLDEGRTLFGNMKHEDDLKQLSRLFAAEKRARRLLDFDDLLCRALDIVDGLPREQRPLWFLVDELQDTDALQMEMILRWRRPEGGIMAVGDPNQMIYSWRGGERRVFALLTEHFGARELTLGRNYRSSRNIVEAARFVLGINRQGGELEAHREDGALITLMSHQDEVAEARWMRDLTGDGCGSETTAVLVRTRRQRAALAEHLEHLGVATTMKPHPQEEASCRTFCLAYLSWLREPTRRDLLCRWLEHPEFGPGESADAPSQDELQALVRTWEENRNSAGDWLITSGLLRFLAPQSSRGALLESWLRRWQREAGQGESFDLALFMDHLVRSDGEAVESSQGAWHILTMHEAKGLEFDRVFLSGLNPGWVPLHGQHRDPDLEAEERRLLFVAMTRARHYLHLSWSTSPDDSRVAGEPSPYLDLIPEGLLEDSSEAGSETEGAGSFGPGVPVHHARYGAGVVLGSEGGRITCFFERYGRKSFPADLCPLTMEKE